MTITKRLVRIATRKSALALWQANTVKALLEKRGLQVELNLVVTTGDKMQKGALAEISLDDPHLPEHLKTGKGLFVKEVQEEILSGRADLAVHSMKDLPVESTAGLRTATVLPRANPSDVIIFSPSVLDSLNRQLSTDPLLKSVQEILPLLKEMNWNSAAPIGTTSARRQFFLRHSIDSNSLPITILRGNVDTRLKRVYNNEFSFIMLARAGIDRLNLHDTRFMFTLPTHISVPAPAQGIVAIECREDDLDLRNTLSTLNEPKSSLAAALERTALWLTGGNCHTAFAAYFESGKLNSWAASGFQRSAISFSLSSTEHNEWLNHSIVADHSSLFADILRSNIAHRIYAELKSVGYDKLMTLRSPIK